MLLNATLVPAVSKRSANSPLKYLQPYLYASIVTISTSPCIQFVTATVSKRGLFQRCALLRVLQQSRYHRRDFEENHSIVPFSPNTAAVKIR